jgi:hypothetical protein
MNALQNAQAEYTAALATVKALRDSGCADQRAITRASERCYKAQMAFEREDLESKKAESKKKFGI